VTPVDELCSALSKLSDVTVARSRFGARRDPAWRIDGREFAHLHSESVLDLRLPRAIQAKLRGDPRARFRARPSEWLEFEFRTSRDVVDLLVLVQEAAGLPARRRPG
jgi:hypothetical protein